MARAADRPVPAARRHLTILNLAVAGLPETLLVATLRLVMAVAPPCAFRVVLDSCVVRADRALIVASEQVVGFRRAQRDLLAGLRRYALDLPARHAAVHPHVTLGYDCKTTRGMREIEAVGRPSAGRSRTAAVTRPDRVNFVNFARLRLRRVALELVA